jgi:hypothetical protein
MGELQQAKKESLLALLQTLENRLPRGSILRAGVSRHKIFYQE